MPRYLRQSRVSILYPHSQHGTEKMTDSEVFYEAYADTERDVASGRFTAKYTFIVYKNDTRLYKFVATRLGRFEATRYVEMSPALEHRLKAFFNPEFCLEDGELMSAECLNGASGDVNEMSLTTQHGRQVFCTDIEI